MKDNIQRRIGRAFLLVSVFVALIFCCKIGELEYKQNTALEELELHKGEYDEQSIVLYDTTHANAQKLAELFGAELRITKNGQFARLTLPDGVTIRDIFADDENLIYLTQMSADYQVQINAVQEDEEGGDRVPIRPQYSVSDEHYELQEYLDYLNMGDVWQILLRFI